MHVCLRFGNPWFLLFWVQCFIFHSVGNQGLVCHLCIMSAYTFLPQFLPCGSHKWPLDIHFVIFQKKSVESGYSCRCVSRGGVGGFCQLYASYSGRAWTSLCFGKDLRIALFCLQWQGQIYVAGRGSLVTKVRSSIYSRCHLRDKKIPLFLGL